MTQFWHIKGGCKLSLGYKSLLVGILNLTPDSFSDGGAYCGVEQAAAQAEAMRRAGADIIDIGGESTHPNAAPISAAEEQRRILPVIKALTEQNFPLPLSVDTYRPQTALAALKAGAHIVNDIFGLQKDSSMADIIAEMGAGVIIMQTGRERKKHNDALTDQRIFFERSLEIAAKAKIKQRHIVLDPGFGFAKTAEENWILLRKAEILRRFSLPLLAGTSRKGFLGKIARNSGDTDNPSLRDAATAATSVILRLQGFSLFRVHNIAMNRQALNIADKIYADSQTAKGVPV